MIHFEEAKKTIGGLSIQPSVETVSLSNSLYRVLAEDITADMNMPPFDKSAMDGFACRLQDIEMPLTVKETIAAGQNSDVQIGKGECVRIMTGARIPEGSDTVIKFEDTETLSNGKIRFTAGKTVPNICYLGEDVHSGDCLIKKGTMVEPRHVPVMAGMGYAHPAVYTCPSIGIFVTGDELVDVSSVPTGTQIRNSNGPQLEAQCRAMHLEVRNYGMVRDSRDSLKNSFDLSVKENEVTIISGGVSVGDFDYVPDIVKSAGFNIHFHGIKVKPGKRMLFASHDGRYVFGLPGNPVSALIQFEMLVKPLLYILQGKMLLPETEQFRINGDYRIRNISRTSFVPILIHGNGTVDPLEYHGSAHIFAYASANGFMEIPEGVSFIRKGDTIHARRL